MNLSLLKLEVLQVSQSKKVVGSAREVFIFMSSAMGSLMVERMNNYEFEC